MSEGERVFLWFFENGLSPALKKAVDYYFNFEEFFFKKSSHLEHKYFDILHPQSLSKTQ